MRLFLTLFTTLGLAIQIACYAPTAAADTTTFGLGTIIDLQDIPAPTSDDPTFATTTRHVTVELIEKSVRPHRITIDDSDLGRSPSRRYDVGDTVVIAYQQTTDGSISYAIAERYRLPWVGWVVLGFLALAILIGGRYGAGSVLGLMISAAIIGGGIVPAILAGYSPTLVALIAVTLIAFATFYPAHGFTLETTIALGSTILTAFTAFVLAIGVTHATALFGFGTEDAMYLATSGVSNLDLHGILLAGIVIGALGVLNDTTIAQVATITELTSANALLTKRELFTRALRIGKQHIASMINTLVLAYAGAALPLFLLVAANPQPLWVTLNNETIAEEIVRTMIGSTAIILAIPFATLLAALQADRLRQAYAAGDHHTHACNHHHD